ncbi:hypothetical protein [Algoriphagus aquimarinus]|uniref:DUF4252 domain-containing protein n=1 Tax=Algoriphagus aquimarinus TaxID=237018 RepID=A0A1I1BZM0_9BACT|nr:hypothetical protein [Algoriphagus aquimarinus]SFB55176.1 hypothetical protein SAMN04489723_11952 [Algoriphagus aquimarinus]
MNIKKNLLTAILLTICSLGFAQDYKQNIAGEFTEYLNSIVNMEFEKSMGYITPEFFEIVPKAQMIQLMEQTFNNPAMEFEIKNPKILAIDVVQNIEDKYYSLLTYSNQMDIKMKSEEETEDEKKMRLNLLKVSFEQTFGIDNVKYNEETEFFEIQSQKEVYAISINGETDWKFLVIEKNQKVILEKILPKELSEKI